MSDLKNKEQRSRNMGAIKSSNTLPEIYIRKLLHSEGFRYRINKKSLPGKPDIVLARYKTIVFIHGCFWHKHSCYLGTTPKSNVDFWIKKLDSNVIRDRQNIHSLLEARWKVIIIWGCAIKGKHKLPESTMKSLLFSYIRDSSKGKVEIDSNNT